MDKIEAIRLLGGTVASAAERVGVTRQAINKWPPVLPPRLEDRVIAALLRNRAPVAQVTV